MRTALFERFTLEMTLEEAQSVSHPACDKDVKALAEFPHIQEQFERIDPLDLMAELAEYGAWDDTELADHDANLHRILWIAGGNIVDEEREESR